MPTRQIAKSTKNREGRIRTRRPLRRKPADAPHAVIVEGDEPTHVLVPVNEYDRLIAASMVPEAIAILEDKTTQWIDFDDWKLQLAGERIAKARKAAGLTQKQLAARLKVPQSQISRIERNPDRTTVRTLKRIAKALGVDVRALL